MNSLFTVNPELKNKKNIVLWYQSEKSQELFSMLSSQGIMIDGFCTQKKRFPSFLGKKVYTVMELIEEGDYGLIIDIASYQRIIDSYKSYGLDDNRVFVWVNENLDTIYI